MMAVLRALRHPLRWLLSLVATVALGLVMLSVL